MSRIPLINPDFPQIDEWAHYLEASYQENMFSNYGPLVRRLSNDIDTDMGHPNKSCLPVANATLGLQITLQALNAPGRKVLTQAFTFPATLNAIVAANMVPVFMDVGSQDWLVQPETLDAALESSKEIAAVMIVRTLGLCTPISEIEAVCQHHNVPLIVDSAGCFGGLETGGRKVGLAGLAEVFSFHATKPFSIGEGGLIVGDKAFIENCKIATNFGLCGMEVVSSGTNAKLSEVAAAIALARRKQFAEKVVAPRSKRAQLYMALFAYSDCVAFPTDPGQPSWQFFPVRLQSSRHANQACEMLNSAGYGVRGYYRPSLHNSNKFSAVERFGSLEISTQLSEEVIALPLHSGVTTSDIEEIVDIIISVA